MSGGIVILIEHLKGEILDSSFEMLGAGRRIAGALGLPVWSVLLGKEVETLAGQLGSSDAVIVLSDPQLEVPSVETVVSALARLFEQKEASLVLVAGTNLSSGIGARLAVRLKLPHVNFCKGLRIEDGVAVFTSHLFGGKMLTDVRFAQNRGIVSVYPGSFPADEGKSDRVPPIEKIDLALESPKVTFIRFIEPAPGDVDITKQDVLVSVGRGIQTQDNLPLAEELADALGGAVSASRPIIDQGWLPLTRQVGKSGMSVRPKLYLALGISGAPEHQEGMKNAQLIIAVNTDPKAPIFDIAHYGTTADAVELAPLLKEELEKRKTAK